MWKSMSSRSTWACGIRSICGARNGSSPLCCNGVQGSSALRASPPALGAFAWEMESEASFRYENGNVSDLAETMRHVTGQPCLRHAGHPLRVGYHSSE